ncbi:unnamed protein product [Diamesa hyperborea]
MSGNKDEASGTVDKNVGIISMQDFLHFLKLTCRVNDSIETNSKTNLSYDTLAKNELVNNLMKKYKNMSDAGGKSLVESTSSIVVDDSGKKKKKCSINKNISLRSRVESCDMICKNLNPCLTEKLEEVLGEGILDSFLPFVCQSNVPKVTASVSQLALAPPITLSSSTSNFIKTKQIIMNQKQSSNALSIEKKPGSTDAAKLTIHVCDEVKGISRDFTCPQKLLVSKMGYFADITSVQKLEDMDISVHCDLEIFNWLILWIKKETMASQDNWPKLDPSNVIPILVSASFLQMEPLLVDCLSFCHSRLSEIVKASSNLACLNDNIITRLAAMFTNLELEVVKDKKDRIQPRLFCKMIQSLCEIEAQSLRGHYATLAGLFRCTKCGKYLTQSASTYIHCVPANMKLNRWGQILSSHVRDVNWSLTNFVANLHKELRSWRKVYWRLWACCHFLYCSICQTHFPACQMQWCLYHPEQSQFLGPQNDSKIGRYPCCGLQMAFRYENIMGPSSGCQFRDHIVVAENDRDRAILNLVNMVSENNSMMFEAPPATKPNNLSSSNEPWWTGMSILSNRTRQGILPTLHLDDFRFNHRKLRPSQSMMDSSSEETESSEYNKIETIRPTSSSSSSDGEESEYSCPTRSQYKKTPQKRRIKAGCRSWSANLSARSNQDNQREYEERAMKQINSIVSKKTGISDQNHLISFQQGGTFIKLENEWRETVKRCVTTKTAKTK